MKCPKCNKPMSEIGQTVSHNGKEAPGYKEYNKTTYQCVLDDVWVVTELPIVNIS